MNRMLVVFGVEAAEQVILEISGKWLLKEHDRQIQEDRGHEYRIAGYIGVGNQSTVVHAAWERLGHPKLMVWEGSLDDINIISGELEFKGEWRLLTDGEWECVRSCQDLWLRRNVDVSLSPVQN